MNSPKLRARMVEMGYTNNTLAEAINISTNALSRKINGITQFKACEIEAISELLQLSTPKIIFDIFLPMLSHICND